MPCYDDRSCRNGSYYYEYEIELKNSQELNTQLNNLLKHYKAQTDYNAKLVGMLCAIISELSIHIETEQEFIDFIKSAETNGLVQGILDWFSQHQQEDIKRFVDNGLPENASLHEQILWDIIQNESK